MPNWTPSDLLEYARKQNQARSGRGQAGKPERPVCNEPLGEGRAQKEGPTRTIVRIMSYRVRLLDKDNLYGGAKPYVDALRYCGALEDDSPDAIDLEITQEKVSQGNERTEIEIELI